MVRSCASRLQPQCLVSTWPRPLNIVYLPLSSVVTHHIGGLIPLGYISINTVVDKDHLWPLLRPVFRGVDHFGCPYLGPGCNYKNENYTIWSGNEYWKQSCHLQSSICNISRASFYYLAKSLILAKYVGLFRVCVCVCVWVCWFVCWSVCSRSSVQSFDAINS